MLERGYQVLCLDQRGTGLSNPIEPVALQWDNWYKVNFKNYRADTIVRDCEAVRKALVPGEGKWSVMGQSFGGFCITTYLSFWPQGVREAFVFGGLPPLVEGPDEVYRRLARRVKRRNEVYYQKFPEDVARVKRICSFLGRVEGARTGEGLLTARRFLQIGIHFGFHGGIDAVHEFVPPYPHTDSHIQLLNMV